jgi:hypothetical protein
LLTFVDKATLPIELTFFNVAAVVIRADAHRWRLLRVARGRGKKEAQANPRFSRDMMKKTAFRRHTKYKPEAAFQAQWKLK